MDEVFNEHYIIDNDTFHVIFFIRKGHKVDGGMMPYHQLQIHKLGDTTKYTYTKDEVGFEGKREFVKDAGQPNVTWTDKVNKELFYTIKNQKAHPKFFVNPLRFGGF